MSIDILKMNSVKHLTTTPNAEATMIYIARVSNPANQDNEVYSKLISYCIKHEHWSVFEHAYMTLEITTTRAISAQLMRHRSFVFQEFSQRYATIDFSSFDLPELRAKHPTNRQSSIDSPELIERFYPDMSNCVNASVDLYNRMLESGVAPETARFVLPMCAPTKLYMTGNCRSWIHYIQLREANGTQNEHRDIALECKEVFISQFPFVSEALNWR